MKKRNYIVFHAPLPDGEMVSKEQLKARLKTRFQFFLDFWVDKFYLELPNTNQPTDNMK